MTSSSEHPDGARTELPVGPLTVVAPRVRDGVAGCGAILADRPGSVVAAPLAGSRTADELAIDLEVLGMVSAEPAAADLEHPHDVASAEEVAAHLQDVVSGETGAAAVLIPLGVGSEPSRLVADASLLVFADLVVTGRVDRPWFLYLDVGAGGDDHVALTHRREVLEARGHHLDAVPVTSSPGAVERWIAATARHDRPDPATDRPERRTTGQVWLLSHPGGGGFGDGGASPA